MFSFPDVMTVKGSSGITTIQNQELVTSRQTEAAQNIIEEDFWIPFTIGFEFSELATWSATRASRELNIVPYALSLNWPVSCPT